MLLDVDLRDKRLLIVGGGKVAERKVRKFLDSSAVITVVGEQFTEPLERMGNSGLVTLVQQRLLADDKRVLDRISDSDFVIVASSDIELNRGVSEKARLARIPTCVVDDKGLSDFTIPSIASVGDIRVAVSTGGRSPAMARLLRLRIQKTITRNEVLQVKLQEYARRLMKQTLLERARRKKILYQIIRDVRIEEMLVAGRFGEAKGLVREKILGHLNSSIGLINMRVTYRKAHMPILEALRFGEIASVYSRVKVLNHIHECVILQTCNRVEIFAVTDAIKATQTVRSLTNAWKRLVSGRNADLDLYLELSFDSDALLHLLRLASGLESMIVGEEEILTQVKKAFKTASRNGATGPVTKLVFSMATKLGSHVRSVTGISRGAISVGSAAVALSQELLDSFENTEVLLIGTGEVGLQVAQSLAKKNFTFHVANRTYEEAEIVARRFGGHPVPFGDIVKMLSEVELVIVATSSDGYLLTKQMLAEVDRRRTSQLVIFDLSNPRNVEESIASLPGMKLFNLDDLRSIAQTSARRRLGEVEEAEGIVQEGLADLVSALRKKEVELVISAIYRSAEESRGRELSKAIKMMHGLSDYQRTVLSDLSRKVMEDVLRNPTTKIREAAEKGDSQTIDIAQELFSGDWESTRIPSKITSKEVRLTVLSRAETCSDRASSPSTMDGWFRPVREVSDDSEQQMRAAEHTPDFCGPFRDAAYSKPISGERKCGRLRGDMMVHAEER